MAEVSKKQNRFLPFFWLNKSVVNCLGWNLVWHWHSSKGTSCCYCRIRLTFHQWEFELSGVLQIASETCKVGLQLDVYKWFSFPVDVELSAVLRIASNSCTVGIQLDVHRWFSCPVGEHHWQLPFCTSFSGLDLSWVTWSS